MRWLRHRIDRRGDDLPHQQPNQAALAVINFITMQDLP